MTRIKLADMARPIFFCDPAGKKKGAQIKRVRARSAIVGVTQDSWGRIFVLVAWAARCSTDALTDKIFELNDQFRPRMFGIEANAMQSLYGDMVGREARSRQFRVPINEVTQPTNVDKDWRIRTTLQPVIADGRLFVPADCIELRQEIINFPMSPTKDIIDALASAVKLLPAVHTRAAIDYELERRLAYLRETGAPPAYIQSVAAGRA
jgi:hypothetical protein